MTIIADKDKLAAFRRLHEAGCFVIPNPWDRGTACYLASAGFSALATSSAALAFSRGVGDSPTSLSLDVVLENIGEIVEATPLPVNADFQAGYGQTADEVAHNVGRCVAAGVCGLSIEDACGDPAQPLYALDVAVSRIRAARAAIDASGRDVLLTGRAESFLVGHPAPMNDVLERLTAYAEAGADVLYAPGPRHPQDIRRIVDAVAPLPVNVLATDPSWMTVASLAALGVRRISVG